MLRAPLLLALACTAAHAADVPLDFTLTWEDAEHSRDSRGTTMTFEVKGDEVTWNSQSHGSEEMPPLPNAKPFPRTAKLSQEQSTAVRTALQKTSTLQSVGLKTLTDVGPVRVVTLVNRAAKGKPQELIIQARTGSLGAVVEGKGKKELSVLDELRGALLAAFR
jgi:hypothetical protein